MRSLGRVSCCGGRRRTVDAGLEQRDLLHDVRRIRKYGRGDDASKVVREEVRRVEAAVLGAVAPPLPAGGTSAAKEAPAPGAAAAYKYGAVLFNKVKRENSRIKAA